MDKRAIEEQMADYLGGELSEEKVARFEAALTRHPDLEKEIGELKGTLGLIRSMTGPESSVESSEGGRRHWPWALCRYAAVLILAFTAGYFCRGESGSERGGPSPRSDLAAVSTTPSGGSEHEPWELAFAQAYSSHASSSRLARSFVALNQSLNR